MEVERLVTLANDIAAFYAAWDDPAAAATEMTSHLRRFWEPRMRRALVAHVQGGGEGLVPLARAAALALTDEVK